MRRHVHVVLVAKQGIRECRLNNQAASDRKRVQDQQIKLKRDMFNDVKIEIHSSFELVSTQMTPEMRAGDRQGKGFRQTAKLRMRVDSRNFFASQNAQGQ